MSAAAYALAVSDATATEHWRAIAAAAGWDERELIKACRRRRFKRGEVIFHEGDPGGGLHLIDVGRVAVKLTTPAGEAGLLDVLQPGEAFGEQSLVHASGVRTATACAVGRVETLVLEPQTFAALRAGSRGVDEFLLMLVSRRLAATSQRLIDALYLPAEDRIRRSLRRLAAVFATGDGDDQVIPLTQNDIAEMAGVTRSTANRVLRELQTCGLITITRGRIEIADPDALTR
jgi:CRP/FNR family cyclic AMP-dependent transcriptional regulator